jgi:hypothetical protein
MIEDSATKKHDETLEHIKSLPLQGNSAYEMTVQVHQTKTEECKMNFGQNT